MIEHCLGKFGKVLRGLDVFLMERASQCALQVGIWSYLGSDRRPWRFGHEYYRRFYLEKAVNNRVLIKIFKNSKPLPPGYGFRLDGRVVEIPWVLAHVASRTGRLLDAGSSLNYDFVLTAPPLSNKNITIITLSP